MKRRAIVAVLALMGCGDPVAPPATHSSTPAAAPAIGSIAGTVRLAGSLKPGPMVENWNDPRCGGKIVDPKKHRSFVLGEGQSLANVYVAVKSGLGARPFATPKQSVLLSHIECAYVPRVLGLMTHQVLRVRNEDDTMHNIHFSPEHNPPFNHGQRRKGIEDECWFPKPEIGIAVKCDVHPWERAWIHISEHPYFAVTAIDGRYSLAGLPLGEYEILAWHERFLKAPLISNVKVESGKTSTLDFTFELPRK